MSKEPKEGISHVTGLVERVVEVKRDMKQIPRSLETDGVQWKSGADPAVQKGVKIMDKPRKLPQSFRTMSDFKV